MGVWAFVVIHVYILTRVCRGEHSLGTDSGHAWHAAVQAQYDTNVDVVRTVDTSMLQQVD